jgi:hypothetical protein
MASYQDIESRLRSVEEKIAFIFDQFKLTKQTLQQVLDEQGRPVVKSEIITLAQAYRELKNGTLEELREENAGESAPTTTE